VVFFRTVATIVKAHECELPVRRRVYHADHGSVSSTILRDGSTVIGNGAPDFTFNGAQYYVQVQDTYATYQINYSNS